MNVAPEAGRPANPFLKGLYQGVRKVSRLPGIRQLIPLSLRTHIVNNYRPGPYDQFPDRVYMEEAMLPVIAGLQPKRVLDVGIEDYSKHYHTYYPADCEYWTIDNSPRVAQYAVDPARHIVGDIREVTSYFEPASLDVVLMNGPFGYGVDTAVEQEETVEAVRTRMVPGGWLMIGWDLAADGQPVVLAGRSLGNVVDPNELAVIKAHFDHIGPGDLPARKDFPDCSHIYDWYRLRA